MSSLLKEKGAMTKNSKPYSTDKVRVILTNPFYYGLFRYGGEIYEGVHTPIVEKTLYDRVQQVLFERTHKFKRKEIKHDLCGLFHCSCGMMITAENKVKIQKNGNRHSYTYYRCSRKSKFVKCKEPALREELLDKRLSDFLLDYAPPQAVSDFLLNRLEQDAEAERVNYNTTRSEAEQKLRDISVKQKILFDSYLEQDIDRETFLNKKAELLGEKKSLSEFLNNFEASQKSWVEPMKKWLENLNSICKIAKSDDLLAKKQLALDLFGLN
ncbi:recombinase family protein, partial [Candidatus Saccharibacteria bacterium]|nr:recombinase family protein [Candidatus Saccharibacteria bacterium]